MQRVYLNGIRYPLVRGLSLKIKREKIVDEVVYRTSNIYN